MPSNRQIGDAIEKEVAEVLRAYPLGFKVWRKPPSQRWNSGEIFGIGDLLIDDGAKLAIGQVKKAHGGFPSASKAFCAEAKEVFGSGFAAPPVWFFWVKKDLIEWFILVDDYTLEFSRNLDRMKID